MSTKLIELEDGTLVMVEVPEDEARPISGGAADRVSGSFDQIKPLLKRACKPVAEVFKELNREMEVEDRLKLRLKEPGTFITPVMQGLPFLGFRIFPGLVRLKRENLLRFQRKMRRNEKAFESGRMDEDAMVRSAMSLLGHTSHAQTHTARKRLFYGE
ncbi:MAG: hypothetical protein ACOC0H_08000 [Thermodesulfobacteriota bacterium]